jgi:hypothetical protein
MKKFLTQYYVVFILIAVFSAPGLSAWYFFAHPDLLGKTSTNKGQLLTPPVLLNTLATSTKWHLIFFGGESCGILCRQQLEKLAKIRLALGRKLYSVDLDLVLEVGAPAMPKQFLDAIQDQGFHVTSAVPPLKKIPVVLIANPDNYLILKYDLDVKPGDIFHDLSHLLNNPSATSAPQKVAPHQGATN